MCALKVAGTADRLWRKRDGNGRELASDQCIEFCVAASLDDGGGSLLDSRNFWVHVFVAAAAAAADSDRVPVGTNDRFDVGQRMSASEIVGKHTQKFLEAFLVGGINELLFGRYLVNRPADQLAGLVRAATIGHHFFDATHGSCVDTVWNESVVLAFMEELANTGTL